MIDVRELHTGKLLFKYDPERDIIEIERRGHKSVVDLRQYRTPQPVPIATVEGFGKEEVIYSYLPTVTERTIR